LSRSTTAAAPKKRGRKLTEAEQYRQESNQKIEMLKNELKKKGLSVAQRQKIRNQISAQQSRLKKKEEFSELEVQHKELIARFKYLTDIMNKEVTGDVRLNLAQKLYE
jgi:uncharacterized protein (DUF3084 family)